MGKKKINKEKERSQQLHFLLFDKRWRCEGEEERKREGGGGKEEEEKGNVNTGQEGARGGKNNTDMQQ